VTLRAAALIIMLVSINSPTFSWAEQLTLPCKFEGSERLGAEREKDVNQIYVDTDIPVVELRGADDGNNRPNLFRLSQSASQGNDR
jgi:hypothetical protein